MSRDLQGVNANEASGDYTFTGANTHSGANTFSGAMTISGALTSTGGQTRVVTQSALVGATVVLTAANSGSLNINRSTSGSPSWTLPTNVAGLWFSFTVANVTAGFTVTGGTIKAKTGAAGTAISGTTLTNTQASAVVGDTITLVADGTNWVSVAQTGIFGAA